MSIIDFVLSKSLRTNCKSFKRFQEMSDQTLPHADYSYNWVARGRESTVSSPGLHQLSHRCAEVESWWKVAGQRKRRSPKVNPESASRLKKDTLLKTYIFACLLQTLRLLSLTSDRISDNFTLLSVGKIPCYKLIKLLDSI